MNQTELPECEKINKKEPSKDVQMTQKQADRLVEHLKNIFMYVRVLRPDEIGDFIIDEENGKLCECYTVWNKAMPCLNCISEKACGRNRRNQNWNALRRMCIRSLQDTWRSKENHA